MSRRNSMLLAGVVAVAAVAAYWMLALTPKREQATKLSHSISAKQTDLKKAQAELATYEQARSGYKANYSLVARLGKAVPADDDAASLVFQIEAAARKAKIDFRSLTVGAGGSAPAPAAPAAPAPTDSSKSSESSGSSKSESSSSTTTGATPAPAAPTTLPPGVVAGTNGMNRLPFTFVFDGDYFSLTKLLDLLRSFTTAKGDTVTVRGRLMTVEGVNLEESRKGFPQVKATVSATAYLSAEPITLPAGANAPAQPGGAAPATTTAPSTQAADAASSTPPVATATPGAIR